MPVTSTIADANDAPWGAAPILNLSFNETEITIIITTASWRQDKTKKVTCCVLSCASCVLKHREHDILRHSELKFGLWRGGETWDTFWLSFWYHIQIFSDKHLLKTALPTCFSLLISSFFANMPGHLQVLMKSAPRENGSHLQSTLQLKRRGKNKHLLKHDNVLGCLSLPLAASRLKATPFTPWPSRLY